MLTSEAGDSRTEGVLKERYDMQQEVSAKILPYDPPWAAKDKIVPALIGVAKSLGWIEKRGRNETQKYDYVQAADVAAEIREKLYAAGVFVVADCGSPVTREYEGNTGKKVRITTVNVRWTFYEQASGQSITVSVPGEAMDAGDKAVYKAMTGSLKYALMLNFLLPTGDDPEKDSATDEVYTSRASPSQASGKAARSDARPSQPTPASPAPPKATAVNSGSPGLLVPFGKHKDKALSAVPTNDLEWLAERILESINNPERKNFKEKNQKLYDAMLVELEMRNDVKQDEQKEPDPENVPF